jgi:hypothetical protein
LPKKIGDFGLLEYLNLKDDLEKDIITPWDKAYDIAKLFNLIPNSP